MADIEEALSGVRAAVDEMTSAAESAAGAWTTPRAPGKWSPSQVVEHIARSLEESAKMVAGSPSKFATLPAPLRLLARTLFFNRVVKSGWFGKAKTRRAFDPLEGPASPAEARTRLDAVLAAFDGECRACASRGEPVRSGVFGDVTVTDYAKFQELHIRHHRQQIPF